MLHPVGSEWLPVLAAVGAALLIAVATPPVLARWRTAPPPGEPRALADLAARVEAIETKLPAYRMEMEAIADRCDEVLEVSERKRRRAAATREPGSEQQQQQPEQIPLDPNAHRAAILRAVRSRRS